MRWLEGPAGTRWMVRYLGARLHRRLFWGFGVSLLVGGGVAWGVHRLLEPSGRAVWIAGLAGGFVLWMMAGGIARRLTRPLAQLVEVTQDIGRGNLSRRMRLRRHGFSDVSVMARAVNDMADRIEKQMADQRELLAAVSHELRTPLGHLRVLVDTARERPGEGALDDLEREILEVDRLVDQLLATSRLDFGELDARDVDAAGLAVRALERLGVDASRLDIETDDVAAQGDPTLLLSALTNLVQNAGQHGGGLTRLLVERDGAGLRFEAWDSGPGFGDDAERVFESFYRGERRAGGSLGLGLALVRRIAAAHGGRAWAANRDEGGARVGFSIS